MKITRVSEVFGSQLSAISSRCNNNKYWADAIYISTGYQVQPSFPFANEVQFHPISE